MFRSSFGGNKQQRFKEAPLGIGQITGIGHDATVPSMAPGALATKWDTRA